MNLFEICFYISSAAPTTTSPTSSWPCMKWRTPTRAQIWCKLQGLICQDWLICSSCWDPLRKSSSPASDSIFKNLNQKIDLLCIPVWPFWKQNSNTLLCGELGSHLVWAWLLELRSSTTFRRVWTTLIFKKTRKATSLLQMSTTHIQSFPQSHVMTLNNLLAVL